MLPAPLRRRVEHRPGLIKILDNIGWLFFDKILRMGVGLLVGVWVARYLGPEQFGQLNYAIAFVGLFGAIAGFGLNGIVVRDIVRDPQSANVTLGTAFFLQTFAGLFAVILIIFSVSILRPDDEFTRFIVAILSLSIIFKSSEVFKYWFESQVKSKFVVWVENGAFILFATIKVGFITLNLSLIYFIWVALAEAALVCVGLIFIYSATDNELSLLSLSTKKAREMLLESWPLILSGLAIAVYMRIDIIMIGEILGEADVGIYSAATRLSEVWYFIPMAICSSVFPTIVRQQKSSPIEYLKSMRQLYFVMWAISITAALFVTAFGENLIGVLFGFKYLGSAEVLIIHIWGGVFVCLGVARGNWILAEGLNRYTFIYTMFGAVFNVLLNLWAIPIYGVSGAAYATIFSYGLSVIIIPAIFPKTRHSVIEMFASISPLVLLKRND